MESNQHAADMSFEERNQLLKNICAVAGLRLPATRVPEGSALWDVDEENKRALQAELEALPSVKDALLGLRHRVAAEQIVDYPNVPVQRVMMEPSAAGLTLMNGEGRPMGGYYGYTKAGLGHFLNFIRPRDVQDFTGNVLACKNPSLRAEWVNHFARQKVSDENIVLRTYMPEAKEGSLRVVRAVVSSKHSQETGDDLAVANVLEQRLSESLQTAKARITRDLTRSEFEIIWPAMQRQLRVGDIAKVFVRVSNSETKAGSLRVEAGLLRALCYNFTTAETQDDNASELSLRHIGDLRVKLPELLKKALERVDPFVKFFADAYRSPLPVFAATRGEVLERVQKVYQLPATTITRASALWDADGAQSAGDTLAGLVNAMTRASQEQEISVAGDTEKAAGKLVALGWRALA